ncbi:hypothetical protein BSL78_29167 [Apostichopus japonicus]|uniref:Uncharacterized protein n=1 Tax=Stichopus japonicus TaxID=307972 RepID=A0A2G8JE43_STIJA|nr:hypothetical protein BSL78_29167 [Apostichopus japonicus]
MLDIHAVEANSMQQRNPLLNFSNLYKYLKVLHKSEHLPQLTPAESVVLLDCFQQLADILRASDTEPQAEFMQNQYRKFFQRLYFAASDMTESRLKLSQQESEAKSKAGKLLWRSRKNYARSHGDGELQEKTAAEETTQKDVESQSLQTEVPDGTNGIQEGLEREGESSQERDECQTSPVGKEGLNERLDVGGDRVADEVSDDMHGRCGEGPIGEATGQDVNDDTLNNDNELCHNLDPNDPDFLAKFADMFSLGSLNPFEIPPELMDFRPKPQGRQTANGNISNQTDGGGTEISEDGTVGDEAIEIDEQGQPSQDREVDLDHQGVAGTSTAGSNRDQYCGLVNKGTGQEVSSNGMEDQRSHHAGLLNNHLSGEVQSELQSAHQLQLSSNHLPVVSSDRLPDASSDRLPDALSDRLPDVSSDRLPDESSDRLPDVSSAGLPDASSDRLPDVSSDRLPDVLSDRLPDVLSDRLPDVLSDRLPEVSCSSKLTYQVTLYTKHQVTS